MSKTSSKPEEIINVITICPACKRKVALSKLCPTCKKQDAHHERKVPKGTCQQCLEKGLTLTKIWSGKYYCSDCLKWNEEGEETGIGVYCRRFTKTYCKNCGKCFSCRGRKWLISYSTRELMIEVMEREDFEALLSWEDDEFKQRYGEIMWELEEVKNLSSKEIRELVNKDIFEKKISKRKFSRGT